MNKYQITHEENAKNSNYTRNIKKNNDYHQQIINPKQRHKPLTNNSRETQNTRHATFTYCGPHTGKITKLFKNTNIRIAFETTNKIQNHLKPREGTIDTHNRICKERTLKYVGKTGLTFKIRYKGYMVAIKTNDTQNTPNIYLTRDIYLAQSTKH
jgi:hypothetical protein